MFSDPGGSQTSGRASALLDDTASGPEPGLLTRQPLLATLARVAAQLTQSTSAIALLSEDRQWLEVAALHAPQAAGGRLETAGGLRVPAVGLAAQALSTGGALLLPAAAAAELRPLLPEAYWRHADLDIAYRFLLVPLVVSGRAAGSLVLVRRPAQPPFTPADAARAEAAARLAAATLDSAHPHAAPKRTVPAPATALDGSQAHPRAKAEEQQRLAQHWEQARDEERAHLAREMHDELGSALTGLKMQLARLARQLEGQPEVHAQLAAATDQIDDIVQLMRRIARDLRPAALDVLGLLPTLEGYFAEFLSQSGLQGTFECPDDELPLTGAAATAVFRIFQEALTNVARHAVATQVNVTVERPAAGRAVVLRINDDGQGMPPQTPASAAAAGHLGLVGMAQRAALFGWQLDLVSAPGAGTTVVLTMPAESDSWPAGAA